MGRRLERESTILKSCWYKCVYDFYKANPEIGWNAKTNNVDMITTAIEYYESQVINWPNFDIKSWPRQLIPKIGASAKGI